MKIKFNWIIIIIIIIIQLSIVLILARMIESNAKTLVEKKNKLWALEDKDKSLYNLQKDYDLIKNDLNLIDQILPDKNGIITFLNDLDKEASNSGLEAKINFNQKTVNKESENVKSINFSLDLKGSYFAINNFIRKIERAPQFIVIENINIQSPDGLGGNCKAVVVIKLFVDPKF